MPPAMLSPLPHAHVEIHAEQEMDFGIAWYSPES
jgi:hypothetical protein